MLILHLKQNCLACALVRKRLEELKVSFNVVESEGSVPTLVYNGLTLSPPITSLKLKAFLKTLDKRKE